MDIVDSDLNFYRPHDGDPDYDTNNPIQRVVAFIEGIELAAEREHYLPDSLQYLLPFRDLGLWGPSNNRDPRTQDEKNDFKKQNVATFKFGDFYVMRGFASAGNWVGSFVKLSYDGGPFSALAQAAGGSLGSQLKLSLKIGGQSDSNLTVPFNDDTARYELELWAFEGSAGNLRSLLDVKGQAALDSGRLLPRPDLVRGTIDAFSGTGFDAERNALNQMPHPQPLPIYDRAPDHTLHPLRTLRMELIWATADEEFHDGNSATGHIVEFSMLQRGWTSYLQVGNSKNPHGGVSVLEYRNLISNYFGHEAKRKQHLGPLWRNELGRDLHAYSFDANTWQPTESPGPKAGGDKRESFFAVDYMDLHILQPDCGIGIHRHRDNQEAFLLLQGKGLMIVGDWCQFPGRERAFEVRTLLPGDIAICKTGQLHALYNSLDEPCQLFMFGGYD